jgi:simple sugar transport system ATP-binding protein
VELLRWLREFADEGNAVVLITHKLDEALRIADDVTVLRHGRTVLTARRTEANTSSLTAAMLGPAESGERVNLAPSITHGGPRELTTDVVFHAERVSIADPHGRVRVREASFEVRAGEIVGIVAVEGSGQRELLRALAGRSAVVTGELRIPVAVGFVPEDRHRDAVLLDRRLVENVALRGAGTRRGRIDWGFLGVRTESLMRAFDVRAPGPDARMRTLSGGNQQKMVLARELDVEQFTGPRAIVVENPTRGLDVRATADVHTRLRAARDAGAAVVMYSSDVDEVLLLANRVLVVFAGHVREAPVDRDVVGRLMLGAETRGDR